ncbi:MAG TPA: diguanylate cyclase [Anaerolineales bacterium]
MKILVLNNDLTERSVIQQVLQRNGHQVVMAPDSQTAWELLQSGEIRFMVGDRTNTDMDEKRFIERVRSSRLPAHIYILLISNKGNDQETQSVPADDYLYKPLSTADLKARVGIGERILHLGDNLRIAKRQLESMAMFDPRTNLYNPKAFLTTAIKELERARRCLGPLSIIMLGIDNFKSITGQYGDETGNDVLKIAGQVVKEKTRPYDCLGHWEEDTFVVALPNVLGPDSEKIALRILQSLQAMNLTPIEGGAVKLSLSVGVAAVSHITPATEIPPLIEHARQAMLSAREAGSNQVFLVYI